MYSLDMWYISRTQQVFFETGIFEENTVYFKRNGWVSTSFNKDRDLSFTQEKGWLDQPKWASKNTNPP